MPAGGGETVRRDVEDAGDERLIEEQRARAEGERRARAGDALVERGGADIAAEGTVDIGERHGAAGTVFDHLIGGEPRSEERCVGKECVSTCKTRRSPVP